MLGNSLGGQAYGVVEALSERIGPRPAGSAEEKRAIDYVSLKLEDVCDQVRQLPVTGIPSAFPPHILLLAGAASLAYCVSELVESPWSMFVFLGAFAVVPRAVSIIRQRASADSDRSSTNVQGVQRASGQPEATVVLCAHVDSARAARVPGDAWTRLQRLLVNSMLPFAVAMSAVAGLRWLDMYWPFAPSRVWPALRVIALVPAVGFVLFEVFYSYVSRGSAFSPGANDNASGVGAVVALAKRFREAPPAHLQMQYLLFTGEESGMVGSRRFVKEADLDKSRTFVINLDMVGSGKQICYVRGAQLLPPRFTDRGLNALLREANPAIRAHYYWMGNSDFDSFLARGFRATSLCVRGDARSEEVYHTERDTLDRVSADTLQMVAETAERTVRLLDEQVARGK